MEDNNKVIYRVYKGLTPIKKIMHGLTVVYEWIDGYIKTKTGIPPIKIDDGNGQNLVNYKVYGETVQEDGTPTPESPIEVKGVGNKTNNLINWDYLLNSGNGITKVENGYYSNSYYHNFFTSTDAEFIRHIKSVLKPGVTYTWSRVWSGVGTSGTIGNIIFRKAGATAVVSTGYGNGLKSKTFSLTQEEIDSIDGVYIYFSANGEGTITEIQLTESEEVLPYEPYGYKIPIEVSGKNLVDMSKVSRGYLNQSGEVLNSGGFQTSDFIDVSNISNISISSAKSYAFYDEEKVFISSEIKSMTIFRSYTIPENAKYIRFDWQTESVNGSIVYAVAGSYTEDTFPPYEPYKEPIKTDIYLDEPLYKIGSYADYIDKNNKEVVRKNKKTTLRVVNDPEKIKLYSDAFDNVRVYMFPNALPDDDRANPYNTPNKCNKFAFKNGGGVASYAEADGEWLALRSGTIYIAVKTENLSEDTIAAAVNYINGLNAEIVYQLAEEVSEDVALPTIKTNIGVNIISVGTEIVPSNMEIQYYK